jgi:cbb3-type cytochrome oxidase maturation protein
MEALYIMIPITLLLSGTALVACIWAIQKGQFDDIDTPPMRILNDFEEIDLVNNNNTERTNA